MIIEWSERFTRQYRALNAATKMRVGIAVGRMEAQWPEPRSVVATVCGGVEALLVDDFVCVMLERTPDGARLLGVRSIEAAGGASQVREEDLAYAGAPVGAGASAALASVEPEDW